MKTTFPAEWAPQRQVIFAFPHAADWQDSLDAAGREMLAAIDAVAKVCPVLVLEVPGATLYDDLRRYTGTGGEADPKHRIDRQTVPLDDSWVRDFGPITVFRDGRAVHLDFGFNGWGGKFRADRDDAATRRLEDVLPYPIDTIPLILEGGSVETDGLGTLLTTTTCLLGAGRNGWTEKKAAEDALGSLLGCDRFLWLEHGHLEGDDTDAHIDTLARFVDAGTIAYVRCDDPDDVHYAALQRMEVELRQFRRRDGGPYRLLPLPWPPAVFSRDDGHRLPASYANFLISNGHLFLPQYFIEAGDGPGRGADLAAVEALQTGTSYRVIPISCRAVVEQHGALHCLTMQLPVSSSA